MTNQDADGGVDREAGAAEPHPRGTQIGRHVVLELRGRGAMGDVYAAYDPELDRKVALKLLRRNYLDRVDPADSDRRGRLSREARALARLNHPNVVTLYDVGTWGDEIFLTMELVEGIELGAWLAANRAPWATICAMFLAAGRGLAAAHAVGLVHRDFKPANVLIAREGTVKVLDFGLATMDVFQVISHDLAAMTDGVVSRIHGVVGTPAYMAPELYDGAAADARTDQYAFCITLYEALHGRRPFGGADGAALQADKRRGRLPPSRVAVPRALQQVVARGLSPDPEDRFASMTELLAALERIPARRKRRLGIAGLVLGGLAFAANRATEPTPAEDGARQIEAVWSDSARSRVRATLLGTGVPYAESTWHSVQGMLDDYADTWIDTYHDAREPQGKQSAAILDLRIDCLRARLSELRALVEVLADTTAPAVEHAVAVVAKLTPLDGCSEVAALTAEIAPPEPALVAEVAAVRERLATVQALRGAGRYPEGLELAEAAAAAAEALAYEPLLAEAHLQLGILRMRMGRFAAAEEMLLASAEAAERIGHHPIAAAAAIEVLYLIGYRQLRFAEAMLWAHHARAAVLQPGVPEHLKADFFDSLGVIRSAAGHFAEAREAHHEALRLRERIDLNETPALADTLHNLAVLELGADQLGAALGYAQRALAIEERHLGSTHPDVAFTLNGLGNIFVRQGDLDAGIKAFERALEIWTRALGQEHVEVAMTARYLATALSLRGQHDEGRVHAERALGLLLRALGGDHPYVGLAMSSLGAIHHRVGDYVEAERLHRRALEIVEATLGPTHPELPVYLNHLVRALVGLGHCEEARALLTRATTIHDANGSDAGPMIEAALASTSDVLRCQGQIDQAQQ